MMVDLEAKLSQVLAAEMLAQAIGDLLAERGRVLVWADGRADGALSFCWCCNQLNLDRRVMRLAMDVDPAGLVQKVEGVARQYQQEAHGLIARKVVPRLS